MGRWTDLAANRWIAKLDVQDAINTAVADPIGAPPIIGDEQFITKAQLQAWVNTSSVTGASNQWVTKSTVTLVDPPALISVSLRYSLTSEAAACAASPATYWVSDNPLVIGSIIRNSNSMSDYAALGWYSDATTVWDYDGKSPSQGAVVATGTCGGGGSSASVVLNNTGNVADICSSGTTMTVYYTGSYGNGTTLYSDSGLTTVISSSYNHVSGPDALIRNITSGVVGSDTGHSC